MVGKRLSPRNKVEKDNERQKKMKMKTKTKTKKEWDTFLSHPKCHDCSKCWLRTCKVMGTKKVSDLSDIYK